MPDQRKRADKQREERQGTVCKIQQLALNIATVVENQIQRPDGNQPHHNHVNQRGHLNVDLIGDNWHHDQQTIANHSAQPAQARVPVRGAVIGQMEETQLRIAWTEHQPQDRLKEFNQRKGIEE